MSDRPRRLDNQRRTWLIHELTSAIDELIELQDLDALQRIREILYAIEQAPGLASSRGAVPPAEADRDRRRAGALLKP